MTKKRKGLAKRIDRVRVVAFDFDGVFTDNTVYVSEKGEESVRCWRGDGLGLQKLAAAGIESFILSTETNAVVAMRAKKLKSLCFHGVADKLEELTRLVAERGVDLSETAYVGNDINDADCLRAVGLAIVVADAHPDVMGIAHYVTRRAGGRGAVREVCDLFASDHAQEKA
ncbi:MAG: 3-deoxy-D-manno-octulosonate 8-phosphate phosphatase [Gemmatimonadetes bacterium]|nr:MAG: 3-deoxy-D-manno-octulosonate 8-phosphate phosphatase [Gemmatimonadota bacterium]